MYFFVGSNHSAPHTLFKFRGYYSNAVIVVCNYYYLAHNKFKDLIGALLNMQV